jgi:hypothetical protein
MTDQPRSRTGRQLAKAAQQAGWTVTVTPGHGTTRIPDPNRPTLGDGVRPQAYIDAPVQSEAVRLQHGPSRAVAVFITLDGNSWTTDSAWLWAIGCTPSRTTPRALLAHLTPERTTP